LIFGVDQHAAVGSFRDGPQVRRDFISPLANIELDNRLGVDGETLVGIHNNTEETRVGVDKLCLKADFQVVEDRGIIEISQVSHVLTLLKLGRVDLSNLGRWEDFFL